MNLQFEQSHNRTNEWYTPREIFEPLGSFDLDPCAPLRPLWDIAKHNYTIEDNGLAKEWFGRVWLNPPYEQPYITQFVEKMALHGNGIALLFNRCDNRMFHEVIFPTADSLFFLRDRISFYHPDGTKGDRPGCGSILISWGEENTESVLKSGHIGSLFRCMNKREIGLQKKMF